MSGIVSDERRRRQQIAEAEVTVELAELLAKVPESVRRMTWASWMSRHDGERLEAVLKQHTHQEAGE